MRALFSISLLAACGGTTTPPVEELPPWEKNLPVVGVMAPPDAFGGFRPARAIVHLHSPYSHDACDGEPRDAGGVPNEPCLSDLRAALCATHVDIAALTDHDDSMADETFTTLFSMRGGDEPLLDAGGRQFGSRMTCDDGHTVNFFVGGENELMPIMLHEHVAGTVQERHDTYNGEDAIAAQAFRTAGGITWVAHTESKSIELLREAADGIEVYNLHANIDPDIRRDFLGLDPGDAIAEAAEFADTNPGHPEPDLAMLAFLEPNQPAIQKWHTLLGEGRRISVTAGSDAHQNAIPIIFADNERGDSYRRVLRWFSNVALVGADQTSPDGQQDAMAGGRLFSVFEILGTPEGFDVVADAVSGGAPTTLLPGNHTLLADGVPTLTVKLPHVYQLDARLPAPTIRARVIHIAPGGTVTEVANTTDAELTYAMAALGAYRVELSIIPYHLGPYLGDLGTALAERELPWIYVSPIYVE